MLPRLLLLLKRPTPEVAMIAKVQLQHGQNAAVKAGLDLRAALKGTFAHNNLNGTANAPQAHQHQHQHQ